MKMFVLLFVFAFLRQANSLQCRKCHSESYVTCDESEKVDECRNEHDQCYWLIYSETLTDANGDTEKQDGFKKGCSKGKLDCESKCQRYPYTGYYSDCKVICCDGNLCNDKTFKDVFGKNKRAVTNGADSFFMNYMLLTLLLLFGIAYLYSSSS